MNGFLALGQPGLILHSPDAKVWTEVFRQPATGSAMKLVPLADDGAGTLVTGHVGAQGSADALVTSHDDGLTWVESLIAPVTIQNSVSNPFVGLPLLGSLSGNSTASQSGNLLWDGAQVVAIEDDGGLPFVSMFSPDGDTWTNWGQTTNANTYVPNDLVFFNGIYVGFANINTGHSLMWSPTAGKGAGAVDPGTFCDWTVGQDLGSTVFSNFFKSNGDYLLAFFGADLGGDSIVYKSTDGKAWVASAALNGMFANNGKDSVWWDAQLALWVLCGGDNGGSGIFTSPDGLVWTAQVYDPTFTLSFNSVRRTGWFLSAVGLNGIFYISTDGITWTPLNAACPSVPFDHWDLSFIHSFSNYFIALGSNDNAPFQQALLTSPDGMVWTDHYDYAFPDEPFNLVGPAATALTSYINACTGQPVFPPGPVPSGPCVDFEIQSPGDMPDSGAQFTGQRLYITANLNVSDVPQVITPTLIVDGVEIVLPQITNTARGTIELPISQYHGRFFDGVRLDGCLTGRIEIFRIEADVWLGDAPIVPTPIQVDNS